jgi:hypothetical protein
MQKSRCWQRFFAVQLPEVALEADSSSQGIRLERSVNRQGCDLNNHYPEKRQSSRLSRRRRSRRRLSVWTWLLPIVGVILLVVVTVVVVRISSNRGTDAGTPPAEKARAGNRVTLENFRLLRFGMTYDQVVAIMGPPTFDTQEGGKRSLNWRNGNANDTVTQTLRDANGKIIGTRTRTGYGADSVTVEFFGNSTRANVVACLFGGVIYNAPNP